MECEAFFGCALVIRALIDATEGYPEITMFRVDPLIHCGFEDAQPTLGPQVSAGELYLRLSTWPSIHPFLARENKGGMKAEGKVEKEKNTF